MFRTDEPASRSALRLRASIVGSLIGCAAIWTCSTWVAAEQTDAVARLRAAHGESTIRLCQALGPAAPYDVQGVDCAAGACGPQGWGAMRSIPWQEYAQGEYVGHDRLAHVPIYRLRVDDQLEFVYRVTREESAEPYRLNVGDIILVESFTDEGLDRELVVQPDGTITLRLLGHRAAPTVDELRQDLNKLYSKYYKEPAITVTPLKMNTKLEDL